MIRRLLPNILPLVLATNALCFTPTEDGMYAVFDTSKGEFVVRLAYDAVPLTVGNFVGLAEGAIPWRDPDTEELRRDPLYDGTTFYQVVANHSIWAGDPAQKGDGLGGPGYSIPDEMHPNLTMDEGAIVMYNRWTPQENKFFDIGENTGGSEFFILTNPWYNFEGHYSVFGYVIEGMDVVKDIAASPVDNTTGAPTTDIVINSVAIVREGAAAEAFALADLELPKPLIRTSNDLKNWSEETYELGQSLEEHVIERAEDLGNGEAIFAEFGDILVPDYEETLAGATYSVELNDNVINSEWVHSFHADGIDDEDSFGPVSTRSGALRMLGYSYHRLPNGARLKIVTSNGNVITYYLRFTDGGSGGVMAWVDNYPLELRYIATGTFTLTPRP